MPETLAELRRCGVSGFWPFLVANVAERHIRCYPWTGGNKHLDRNLAFRLAIPVFMVSQAYRIPVGAGGATGDFFWPPLYNL